jgi:hypothetical protein
MRIRAKKVACPLFPLWLSIALGLAGCVTTAENTFADDRKERPAPKPQGRLEGRVYEFRDPETPLRDAKVTVANKQTVTDADGAFTFEGLRDGEAELAITLPGHRPFKELITLPLPEVLRVGLHSTGTISVALPSSADFKTQLMLRRNGVDEAAFNGELLDGTYQVLLELEHVGECRWRRTAELEVDLVDGEHRKVDFKFDPPMTLSGEVRDGKKKPVAGAKVIASRVFEENSLLKLLQDPTTGFLEDSRCVTDSFGRFTLEGLDGGKYHVLAFHPDHPPMVLDAEAGEQNMKFNLVVPPPEKSR